MLIKKANVPGKFARDKAQIKCLLRGLIGELAWAAKVRWDILSECAILTSKVAAAEALTIINRFQSIDFFRKQEEFKEIFSRIRRLRKYLKLYPLEAYS